MESLEAASAQTFVKMAIDNSYSENDERLYSCGLPSDSTLERWLRTLAVDEGWNRSRVTVEKRGPSRGGGATSIVVCHEDGLDEYQVLADYSEAMGIDRCQDRVTVDLLPWTEADFMDLQDGASFRSTPFADSCCGWGGG